MRPRVTLTTVDDMCLDGNRLRVTSGTPTTPAAAGNTYQTEIADFSNITSKGTAGAGLPISPYRERTVTPTNTAMCQRRQRPKFSVPAPRRPTLGHWTRSVIAKATTWCSLTAVAAVLTLTKIQYTATPGTGNAAPYEVDFNYVARTGGTTITKYVAAGTVSLTQQLDNVTVKASGTIVRKYQLGYGASATTTRPLLQTVQECGGSAGTDCIRPTTLSYQPGGAGWSSTATATNLTLTAGGSYIPIDMNGDGYPDALYATPSGSNLHWYLKLGSASGYGAAIDTGLVLPSSAKFILGNFNGGRGTQFLAAPASTWYVYSYNGAMTSASTGVPVNGELLAVDYDGDGLPDLVSVNSSNTVQVRRNTTAPGGAVSFASTAITVWTPPAGYGITGYGASLTYALTPADFNADGRSDLLVSTEHLVYIDNKAYPVYATEVLLSNGFGANATDAYTIPGFGPDAIGDWNGDGCSDIVTVNTIYISNCTGGFTTLQPNAGGSSYWAVDWDGDGQTDLVYVNSGTLYLIRSTGSGMAAPVSLNIPAQDFFAIDQNSDGQVDLAYFDGNGTLNYYAHNGVNTPPDLATSIAMGSASISARSYTPISQNNYTKYRMRHSPRATSRDRCTSSISSRRPMVQVAPTPTTSTIGARACIYRGGDLRVFRAQQHDSRNVFGTLTIQLSVLQALIPLHRSRLREDTEASSRTSCPTCSRPKRIHVRRGVAAEQCARGAISRTSDARPSTTTSQPARRKVGRRRRNLQHGDRLHVRYGLRKHVKLKDTKATTTDTDSAPPASPFNGQHGSPRSRTRSPTTTRPPTGAWDVRPPRPRQQDRAESGRADANRELTPSTTSRAAPRSKPWNRMTRA